MRHLIHEYYIQKRKLNKIHNKILDSWTTLFHTSPMSDIPYYHTEVLIYGDTPESYRNDKPAIILALITTEELTTEQINRIKKTTNSTLISTVNTWTDINLKSKTEEKYYSYEFIAQDLTVPDVMESWLKD